MYGKECILYIDTEPCKPISTSYSSFYGICVNVGLYKHFTSWDASLVIQLSNNNQLCKHNSTESPIAGL